jgi:hypothetical protein
VDRVLVPSPGKRGLLKSGSETRPGQLQRLATGANIRFDAAVRGHVKLKLAHRISTHRMCRRSLLVMVLDPGQQAQQLQLLQELGRGRFSCLLKRVGQHCEDVPIPARAELCSQVGEHPRLFHLVGSDDRHPRVRSVHWNGHTSTFQLPAFVPNPALTVPVTPYPSRFVKPDAAPQHRTEQRRIGAPPAKSDCPLAGSLPA